MSDQPSDQTACGNCGSRLYGRYCHACGQKAIGTLGLHDIFHEAFHELAHVDGKIVRTLGLLITKPGALTLEFLSGRRSRYISPLRLYLTCSLLFFALAAVAPDYTRAFIKVKPTPSSGGASTIDPAEMKKSEEIANSIRENLLHNLPRAMFVLMPVFALLTWAFYRRTQPYYVAHLYYAIHFHAFAFLALSLSVMGSFLGRSGEAIRALVMLGVLTYHYVGVRRVFDGSRLQAALKATAIWVLYWMTLASLILVVFLLLLRAEGIL